jgi:hypothetical protein
MTHHGLTTTKNLHPQDILQAHQYPHPDDRALYDLPSKLIQDYHVLPGILHHLQLFKEIKVSQ